MTAVADHMPILPVVLPLVAGAVLLLIDERHRSLKATIDIAAIIALGGIAVNLLLAADAQSGTAPAHVYRLGGWPAPFGIVLVVDRLSALMLVVTSLLALAAATYSLAQWHRMGSHFHSLVQFLLMGLNGAFLTGDLFNLFVFFELLLAASYGLVLHGSGIARVRAGLHYIAVNLAASILFLIGVSLIYSVTGTLNMADLAVKIPQVAAADRALLEAGAGALGIAFLVKAGIWPLSFWLPTAYSAAAPPVAALFSIMSKVGLYAVLRLWLLLFGGDAAAPQFGGAWLLVGGMATIAFGAIGVLASQDMRRLAGFAVLVSSGTIMAAVAAGHASTTGAALFYLVSSTLAIAALFMLIELIERGRDPVSDMLAVTREAFGEDDDEIAMQTEEVGIAIPATMAFLGLCFLGCALVLAGLPPLSGFISKFAILSALLEPGQGSGAVGWTMLALLVLSGLMTLIAMTRAGIRTLWIPLERDVPRVRVIEIVPVAVLLLACATLTVQADAAMRYMQAAAGAVHAPQGYVRGVLDAPGQRGAPHGGGR